MTLWMILLLTVFFLVIVLISAHEGDFGCFCWFMFFWSAVLVTFMLMASKQIEKRLDNVVDANRRTVFFQDKDGRIKSTTFGYNGKGYSMWIFRDLDKDEPGYAKWLESEVSYGDIEVHLPKGTK